MTREAIDVTDRQQVDRWAARLGISAAQLRVLVDKFGKDVDVIQANLNWRSQPIRSARQEVARHKPSLEDGPARGQEIKKR
jgi:hypothetical protein